MSQVAGADGCRIGWVAALLTETGRSGPCAQVDLVMRADPSLQARIHECHPEVCFAALEIACAAAPWPGS
jgi:predicted RNase H-like nuclease